LVERASKLHAIPSVQRCFEVGVVAAMTSESALRCGDRSGDRAHSGRGGRLVRPGPDLEHGAAREEPEAALATERPSAADAEAPVITTATASQADLRAVEFIASGYEEVEPPAPPCSWGEPARAALRTSSGHR
jgi:hypothetical protein